MASSSPFWTENVIQHLPLTGGAEPNQAPSPFTPPQINLPKGGAAIRGIGEKFTSRRSDRYGWCQHSYRYQPRPQHFGPRLTVAYDSSSGNGPFGLDWKLAQPAITRKTDKGIHKYNDSAESESSSYSRDPMTWFLFS
jgi:Salmonella virulence plasmid 65kDa B protein